MFEPIVTVLMPVYNGSLYLREAIDSILGQTFQNFEFLIIDDGSTDDTADVIRSYKDGRIRVLKNDTNCGISKSLNIGIQNARGQYIARMDSDDVSRSDRLYKQVLFMEQHHEIIICGSWVKTIGGPLWSFYTEPDQIKCQLLFANALAHPSVIMRRNVFIFTEIYYDISYHYAQDYKLWAELSKKVLFVNIPEALVAYRLHSNQLSAQNWSATVTEPDRIKREQLQALGVEPTPEEMEIHRRLSSGNLAVTTEFAQMADRWLLKLEQSNEVRGYYPKASFIQIINHYRRLIGIAGG